MQADDPRAQPKKEMNMTTTAQIQIDHASYPKALQSKSEYSLKHIIKDCQEAINAMPGGAKAGYYADEINYCVIELHRRKTLTA